MCFGMEKIFELSAFKITFIYLLLGFIWIYFTDYLVVSLYIDSIEAQRFIQTTKGFFFVSISGLVIYILVDRFKIHLKNTELSKIESLQKHLKEKNVLLAEVHHRVKNNLAIITSLLQLQADKAPESMKTISDMNVCRIKSMALIHELLYQSDNYATIDMKNYCEKLMSMLKTKFSKESTNIQLECEFEDSIQLDLTRAIPVGIIASEVISNAYLHAFKNTDTGIINVDFRETENHFILTIKDDGTGYDMNENLSENSLGIKLIDGLANQIDANSVFESSIGMGTRYQLILKV